MNKEEILAKSRAEGKDEGEQYAHAVGESWGFVGMIIVLAFLYLATIIINEEKMYLLESAKVMFFLATGISGLGYGIKSQRKSKIILGALWLLLGVVQTVLYFKLISG